MLIDKGFLNGKFCEKNLRKTGAKEKGARRFGILIRDKGILNYSCYANRLPILIAGSNLICLAAATACYAFSHPAAGYRYCENIVNYNTVS